jgi:hypothetical protein
MDKSSQKLWAISENFQKPLKVNNHSLGENLVTLLRNHPSRQKFACDLLFIEVIKKPLEIIVWRHKLGTPFARVKLWIMIFPQSRVARFFLVQIFPDGKNIPNDHEIYQTAINYTT